MPSKPPLTLADYYTVIVEMGNLTDPSVRWRNTWDLFDTSVPAQTDPVIDAIQNFHLYNLRTDAGIFLVTLRNWSQGPQPFANRPFIWEIALGGTAGLKSAAAPHGYSGEQTGGTNVPGINVAFVKRVTEGGKKNTALFLRGLYDGDDVTTEVGGKWVTKGGSRVTSSTFQATANAAFSSYFGNSAIPHLAIVHVGNHGAGPAFASPIDSLQLIGPSTNKQTRKNKK